MFCESSRPSTRLVRLVGGEMTYYFYTYYTYCMHNFYSSSVIISVKNLILSSSRLTILIVSWIFLEGTKNNLEAHPGPACNKLWDKFNKHFRFTVQLAICKIINQSTLHLWLNPKTSHRLTCCFI